jgi:two-component system, OmpR family, sensor kinase
VWGTSFLRNIYISIFVFYILSVVLIVFGLYFLVEILQIQNRYIIVALVLSIATVAGVIMAKSATEPLMEYFNTLQNYSKDTLHELNIPISTIKANVQMLEKNLSDEKMLKRVWRIKDACDSLQHRYDELDYLIKKQMKKEHIEEFELSTLILKRVEVFKLLYPKLNLIIDLDSCIVKLDKIGLSKVLDNILDNAIKYSSLDSTITLTLHDHTLEIEDIGIGMDEVELLHIYDRYYQSNHNSNGFGIGMNMIKSFCDQNKIILLIKSQKNIGTKISLNFTGVISG